MTEWRNAEAMCLQFVLGEHPQTIAVLLLDRQADRLLTRFRRDWAGFDEFELEIVSALGEDICMKAEELGASELVRYLLDTLSNTLRVTDPEFVTTADLEAEVERLALEHLYLLNTGAAREDAQSSDRRLSWIASRQRAWSLDVLRAAFEKLPIAMITRPHNVALSFASGVSVLLILFAAVHALRSTIRTAPEPFARPAALTAQNTQLRKLEPGRQPLAAAVLPLPTKHVTRRQRARSRVRIDGRLRTFRAPDEPAEVEWPRVAMATSGPVIESPVPTPASYLDAQTVQAGTNLPAPPVERVSGARRFIYAIALPFRKIGAALAK
jgi:hypothetical protein